MRQVQKDNSNFVENSVTNLPTDIRAMPDPEDIFSGALGAADTSQSFVHIPNIRDGDGALILPQNYRDITDRSIVMVNIYLKLYVYKHFLLFILSITFVQVEFKTHPHTK